MANYHNINTCLRRLRAAVETRQGDWGTLIANEVHSIASENPHGIVDASFTSVCESLGELMRAGMLKVAQDKQHAIVRMTGEF